MNKIKALSFVKKSLENDYEDDFLSDILQRVIEDLTPGLVSSPIDAEGMRDRVEWIEQKEIGGQPLKDWEEVVLYMNRQKGGCYY